MKTIHQNNEDAKTTSRPLANFPPDIWGESFVSFTTEDTLKIEEYAAQIVPLKQEVLLMLMDNSLGLEKKMSLIDTVERLGVSYHYENEIEEQLGCLFAQLANNGFDMGYDLYNTSLQFRIFRQHGYNMPCDVFERYTDSKSKIKEALRHDIRGIVSLYEAAHLRIRGECILDEALAFSTNVLKNNKANSKEACHALKQAFHFGIQRIESHRFISYYKEDDTRNDTLFRLAMIDYNRVQLLHRQELSQLLKWWNELDLKTKLPYARQRSVECHFWTIAMYHEPKYSAARMHLAKTLLIVSILDDTYDAYGTFDELALLTETFERWDLSLTEDFPEHYMKLVFQFVYNTCEEFSKEMIKIGKPYAAQYTKDRVIDLIRSYFVETKWYNARYVPSFEEYMINARITGVAQLITTSSLMAMPEIVEVKPFELILQAPKAIRACEVIGRIMDDIVSHEEEQARGHVATGVECYMKDQQTMSRGEIVHIFNKMVEDSWRELNEEFLTIESKPSDDDNLPKSVLERVRNLARVLHVVYKDIDGYTHSAKAIKDDILATYVVTKLF